MKTAPKPVPARHQDRRNARLLAVQALYQQAVDPKPAAQVVRDFIAHPPAETVFDRSLFGDIVTGADAMKDDLDTMISGHLDMDWRLERLDKVIHAILQAGIWEILHKPDTPTKVILNEYIEVARSFFDQREPAFVNRLLDLVAKKVRPEVDQAME